jgi:hypothetical protein
MEYKRSPHSISNGLRFGLHPAASGHLQIKAGTVCSTWLYLSFCDMTSCANLHARCMQLQLQLQLHTTYVYSCMYTVCGEPMHMCVYRRPHWPLPAG